MSAFLCLRILNSSQFIPTTKSYGSVDIRPPKAEFSFEKKALSESHHSCSSGIDCKNKLRIVTIVDAKTIEDAFYISSLMFEETLDLFEEFSFEASKKIMTDIGYLIDLAQFKVIPLDNKITRRRKPGALIHIVTEMFPVIEPQQYLLCKRNEELTNAIIRAAHWNRLASGERNLHLSFLFRWISIEALAKINADDDIRPKISLCMGFPRGHAQRTIDVTLVQRLSKIPNYRTWKDWIWLKLKEMRNSRNEI
ncbi:hypothetical protein K8T06_08120, partial [bacterium]|nr:hypothetical protein [bacterium]